MYLKQWLRSQLRSILDLIVNSKLMERLDQGQFPPKLEAPKTDLSLPGINMGRGIDSRDRVWS
jgi:hypothetical protein